MTYGRAREAKKHVFELLKADDLGRAIFEIARMNKKKVVNYLISALCNCDPLVKWRAVSALGKVVASLADEDMERARIIMRRFMWMLNDESGGIGWGAPESMAEIMACHEGLAREYVPILVSYLREDANFLEYEPLQRGLLWGVSRLGSVRPQLVKSAGAGKYLPEFLKATDAEVRGMAAMGCGVLELKDTKEMLLRMINDTGTLMLYQNGKLYEKTVGDLAKEALRRIEATST
ncbi:MAG: HEAT repeat domain-containing protein [Deltaproteobacteria bacterium]|nr:MAG: HEAT repeat domain-containing protein [Deltaproteobacteria bacterium]